ncbi:mechanosensitive ion channel family protein [Sulfitobacter sp. D35]|nr:mechanosensitive ion channel family protein [Sulfitobacter sp. D35]MDW4499705.1 mechanosensitive ion channel family protein [Sulfitobacter sp. D35]
MIASPSQAQSLGSLVPTVEAPKEQEDASASDRIAEIMRQARETGVNVVVIDTEGNIVSPPPEDAEADAPEDAAEEEAAGAEVAGPGRLMKVQDDVVTFRTKLVERLVNLPVAFNEVAFILRATSPDGTIWLFVRILLLSCLLFAIGAVVEKQIYGKRFARKYVVGRQVEAPQGYLEKMPFLVYRFFMGVIGILVSMAVAYVLGVVFFDPVEDVALKFTIVVINLAYFLSRAVGDLWRMILSPYLEQYRIPVMTARDARRLYLWLWAVAGFDICALVFGVWIKELGLNYEVYAFLASLLSAVVVLLNITMVLVNRRAISRAFRNGKAPEDLSWVAKAAANLWAPAIIVYMLFAWVSLTYDLVLGDPNAIPLIAGAYGIVMSIIVVYGVINFFIERSFARARALREKNEIAELADDSEPAPGEASEDGESALRAERPSEFLNHSKLHTYEDLARRVAAILAFVAGLYAFFYIWDSNPTRMVESAADQILDVMVILLIGYVLYHAFRIWIDGKIEEEQADMPDETELGDEGSAASSASRLATLLPLFRNFILIVLLVTIVLIVLLQMGINVGPLFAGAGVVGVAVGFGSQALVRDIFSGGFFLFDDAFRKGEYLDVGGVKGTVEKISVRSFQLRHHLGALHTIPFGEIQVMTNYSRDWVIMKLPLRVTYDTDVEKVRKLIKKLGVQLMDDPVIGENFIQPLKSQGVIEMQDSAMIIRVKFMTKPGDQWLVRKKVYQEIRELFEREGIKFAHKEVTVRLADGKIDELSEEERKAVTAAAQSSIEEEMMEDLGEGSGDDR